jgi:ATP-binding cassette subfamily F protein 3
MLSVEGLTKSYGGLLLFDAVGFKINQGERVGLVGRNGHGKTTLFRMLTGAESPDDGLISMPKNYRPGYVTQHIAFERENVLEEAMRGLRPDAAEESWRAEKILFGLGFRKSDMGRPPWEFSGGYQVRLNLAKTLLSEPDLLLLDEPTNYLDITSIRWIKGFLRAWPRELMLITHDRSFMDAVATHIAGIHRRKIKKVAGDTSSYYNQIAQEEAIHEKTRLKNERRQKDMERFISRFRAKARLANLVQSRIKQLDKLKTHEKLEGFKILDFQFREKPFAGKYVLHAQNISFSYKDDGPPLIRDLSISVGPAERIAIIGRNGAGKTTLLKLLSGALEPDRGKITWQPNVSAGVFEQTHVESLHPERSVEEEIQYTNPDLDRQQVRNICGAMLFEGDEALKKISVLSGGEKCRVMIGKLLGKPVNFLLLDEPTNHFDLESSDALLSAVDAFKGALVMVTHNEMFLHALADRLVVFDGDAAMVFEGSYQRFLEDIGWQEEAAEAVDTPSGTSAGSPVKNKADKVINKKEYRRLRSNLLAERTAAVKPLERTAEALEVEIMAAEKELSRLNEEMLAATNAGEGPRIAELSRAIHAQQSRIDKAFSELETASEAAQEKRSEFERKIADLDRIKSF